MDETENTYYLAWASSFCLYHFPFALFAPYSIFLINDCWTRAGVAKTNRNVQELEIVVRSCSYNTSSDIGVKPERCIYVPCSMYQLEVTRESTSCAVWTMSLQPFVCNTRSLQLGALQTFKRPQLIQRAAVVDEAFLVLIKHIEQMVKRGNGRKMQHDIHHFHQKLCSSSI